MKKEITNFLPRLRGKRWPVMALAWMALAGGTAWGQQSSIVWEGEELPAEGGEFYLYNKGGGGFLVGGNDYGTHISIGERGILCTLESDGEGYKVKTYPEQGFYVNPDGWVDNPTAAVFTVADTDADDGENIYSFSKDGGLMSWTQNNGTMVDYSGIDASAEASQWLLVSADQYKRKNEAALGTASENSPVDATFYINGADFNRNQPHGWTADWQGGNKPTIGGSDNKNPNKSAEAWNNDRVDIYQLLTGIKNGRYQFTCQGFYRPGGKGVTSGAQNAFLYAGDVKVALPLMPESWINSMDDAGNVFAEGKCKTDAVEAVVLDGTLRIGIKKETHINEDWVIFDNFRLSYLGELDASEVFQSSLKALESLISEFTSLGATTIADGLQKVYDANEAASGNDVEAAQKAVSDAMSAARAVQAGVESLAASIEAAEAFSAKVGDDGTYILCSAGKEALKSGIEAAKKVLAETEVESMAETAPATSASLDATVAKAEQWIGLSYTLIKAKALAEAITGLDSDETYKKVVTDLESFELDYATMASDVAALNFVCREAMTVEFLAGASAESPIDLTSFIRNPNIYQTGLDNKTAPDGWVCDRGKADGVEVTGGTGDTDLNCYSWTGQSVKTANYYQLVGGATVNLPDGTYRLAAATYTNVGGVNLYASVDGENFIEIGANGNEGTYQTACASLSTTSQLDIQVSGGCLYIGMRGNGSTGGSSGRNWKADNFRLYYIGAPEAASQSISVSDAGMSTYYSANAFTVPEGLTGGVVTSISEDASVLNVDWRYPAGSTVPGHTGILLGGEAGNYTGEYSVANVACPEDNLLDGTLEEATIADAGYKYYKLADGNDGLGFYFAAEGGASITNGANKAYLALSEAAVQEVNFLAFKKGTTGVADVAFADEESSVDVYSVSGVRVRSGVKVAGALDGLPKGIYIVNGKKILK